MDKVIVLCDLQKSMLKEFQKRVFAALSYQRLNHFISRPLQPFLSVNFSTQIDKGRHIVEHTASLVQKGIFPTQQDTQQMLAMSHNIDQVFVSTGMIAPIKLDTQLPLIEPVRRSYIGSVLHETHQLLLQWQGGCRLRQVFAMQYDATQCSKLFYDMLRAISLETRLLGQVVKLPVFFRLIQEPMSQTVYLAMDSVARSLANEMTQFLFQERA